MHEIGPEELARRLRTSITESHARFAFFLGAGCSVSCGIPGAGDLVRTWLPRLKKHCTGNDRDFERWVRTEFKGYEESRAAEFYGRVIERLFLNLQDRQAEIERIVAGKDPGFGYAVLAQLVSCRDYGPGCNVVLTTNFDDLVADALYLYTSTKPLVIVHESLVGFVKVTRTQPLVLKLHGDARLAPMNTQTETKQLNKEVRNVLANVLGEMGLVFIGYGGSDRSIAEVLSNLPANSLPWGVFWVRDTLPTGELGQWLRNRNSVWVRHLDFDELMLLFLNEFGLEHPNLKSRLDRLQSTYQETFKTLSSKVARKAETPEGQVMKKAAEEAAKRFKNWFAVYLAASELQRTNPEEADSVYRKGLEQFPKSLELLGNYAIFLHRIRKDYDRAEEFYRLALEVGPDAAYLIGSYASFLFLTRKDYDRAEELYKHGLEIEPNNFALLGSYAGLLFHVRKDYDRAETFYKRSLEVEPDNAIQLGNYANFLSVARKEDDRAEEFYRRSLEIAPDYAIHLCNYAGFLFYRDRRADGLQYLNKALQTEPTETVLLEGRFYQYAHLTDAEIRRTAIVQMKVLLLQDVRSPGWNLSRNVERAIADGHPQPALLLKLAHVIADEAKIDELSGFQEWNSPTGK
jgi:Tfp pilus assembly protein PilF